LKSGPTSVAHAPEIDYSTPAGVADVEIIALRIVDEVEVTALAELTGRARSSLTIALEAPPRAKTQPDAPKYSAPVRKY
jgi:hypothetical protein